MNSVFFKMFSLDSYNYFYLSIILAFMIYAAVIDFKKYKIFNKFNLGIAVTGFCTFFIPVFNRQFNLLELILSILVGFLFLFVPCFIKNVNMGGDIKYCTALGFWFDWKLLLLILAMAVILNCLWFIIQYIKKYREGYRSFKFIKAPFAVFIAISYTIIYFFQMFYCFFFN